MELLRFGMQMSNFIRCYHVAFQSDCVIYFPTICRVLVSICCPQHLRWWELLKFDESGKTFKIKQIKTQISLKWKDAWIKRNSVLISGEVDSRQGIQLEERREFSYEESQIIKKTEQSQMCMHLITELVNTWSKNRQK